MNDVEMELHRLAGVIYTRAAEEIVGHGECREEDLRELRHAIHHVQDFMGRWSVARAHPGSVRAPGLSVAETEQALR